MIGFFNFQVSMELSHQDASVGGLWVEGGKKTWKAGGGGVPSEGARKRGAIGP